MRSQAGNGSSASTSQDDETNANNARRENRPRRNAPRDGRDNDTPQENTESYHYCVLSENIIMNFEPQRYLNNIYIEFTDCKPYDNA